MCEAGVSQGARAVRMGRLRWLLPLLAALLLGALGLAAEERSPPPPGAAEPPPATRLEDGTWELYRYLTDAGLQHVVSDTGRTYAQFDSGRFRMNAGCGTLRGNYLLEGDRLLFSPHVTSMLGDCPAILADQEETLIALLSKVARIASLTRDDSDAQKLALMDAEGETLVTMQAPDAVPLQGRRWRLIAYRDGDAMIRPALPAPLFTLWFEDAVNLAGVACDRYSASFSREDRLLRLQGPVATSRFGCTQSAAARQQGDAYIEALGAMEAYRVDGDTLLLRDRDGRMLARFRPLTAVQAQAKRLGAELAGDAEGALEEGPGPRAFRPHTFDLGGELGSREP